MAVSNSLTNRNGTKPQTFSAFLTQDAIKNRINSMVGGKDGQRFISAVISAVSVNPTLSECEHSSILSAALLGESLKLSPSPQLGQYYLVPFEDKKRGSKVAQFQLGYKGYIQLAIRTGEYLDIDVIEIREGEHKGRDKRTGKHVFEFVEDETERENLPIIGYLAYFELSNGFRKDVYFSKEKMLNHADAYSKAFSRKKYEDLQNGKIPQNELWKYSSPWYSDFTGMAFKTALRQLISKWGIMSIEMQTAIDKDMAAINEDGSVDYVDNSYDAEPMLANPATGEVIEVGAEPQTAETDPTAGFFDNEG